MVCRVGVTGLKIASLFRDWCKNEGGITENVVRAWLKEGDSCGRVGGRLTLIKFLGCLTLVVAVEQR